MAQRKSIIVYLIGGLGNQLFCLAFAKSLAVLRKGPIIFDDKYVIFGSNISRKSNIFDFKNTDSDLIYRFRSDKYLKFLKFKILRRIYWKFLGVSEKVQSEENLKLSYTSFNSNTRFRDYFANWYYAEFVGVEYFVNLVSKLSLSQKAQTNIELLQSQQPIVIHLRLSDYLRFPNIYRITPEKYFLDSIKFIDQFSQKKIWLFCEEKKDIQTYYPKLYALADKIITNESELSDSESFYLLSKAKNLIITNSSFSQWAGWIAANTGSKVISFCESQNPSSVANYYKWYIYLNSTSQIINPSSIPKEYIIQKEFIESLSIKIRNE